MKTKDSLRDASDGSMYDDGSYLDNNPTWHEEHSAWKAAHVHRLLFENNVEPLTIAEVGCGAGQILVELADKIPTARELVGFEISPQAYALCQKKHHSRVRFQNTDILAEPPSEPFDVAMAIDVFEHVEDYIGFIRSMRSVGKYQVFHIPLELSVSSMLRPRTLARARSEVGHVQFFTRETALASLEQAGLEIVDARYTSIATDMADNIGARALRLPRRVLAAMSEGLPARLFGGYHAIVLTR